MTGRMDTAEGRRLLATHEWVSESEDVDPWTAAEGTNALGEWLFDNADGLLAAAEERDTLSEALEQTQEVARGYDCPACEMNFRTARAVLVAVEARLGEPA